MSALGLRDALRRHALDLRDGVYALQRYSGGDPTLQRRGLPYKSVRTLIERLGPSPRPSMQYCDEPDGITSADLGWAGLIQGVTHDRDNWYFSTTYLELDGTSAPAASSGLLKVPFSGPLRGYSKQAPIPDRDELGAPLFGPYRHYGDIDHAVVTSAEGRSVACIFVPIEHDTFGDPNARPKVLAFDTDFNLLGSALLPLQDGAPWCAINPRNGYLYSSNFSTAELLVYEPILHAPRRPDQPGLELNFVGAQPLTFVSTSGGIEAAEAEMAEVQGGAFSDAGHLYLVNHHEVRKFDVATGRELTVFFIESESGDEMEGITIWPIEASYCGHAAAYQLHVLHTRTHAAAGTNPDIFFKHYFFAPDDLRTI